MSYQRSLDGYMKRPPPPTNVIVIDEDDDVESPQKRAKTQARNAVQELLTHPLTKEIELGEHTFTWKQPGQEPKQMFGVTKPLAKKFYPDYDAPCSSSYSTASGKETGTRVHRQIFHMVECVKRRSGACICKGTRTHQSRLHRWTKQALDEFKRLDITPEAAEIPILSKTAEHCTAIDVIGTRYKGTPREKTVHLSMKTGYKVGYDDNKTKKKMHVPLNETISAPKYHNMLQILIEKMILEVEYGIVFDEHIIVYLGKGEFDTPEIDYLDGFCESRADALKIYDAFCKFCRQ
jgi:hypothetical protein